MPFDLPVPDKSMRAFKSRADLDLLRQRNAGQFFRRCDYGQQAFFSCLSFRATSENSVVNEGECVVFIPPVDCFFLAAAKRKNMMNH
jgi:hypothetical protein